MTAQALLLIVLAAPLARAILVVLLRRPPGLRDVVNVALALAQAVAALMLLAHVAAGDTAPLVLARPLPDVAFAVALEPIGAVAAATWSVLSVAHALHTAGFVRACADPAPARMMALSALASLLASGMAFSANLFTLFVFYQALILVVVPLVGHEGDAAARKAARLVLSTLLACAIGFLLPAMVWTYALGGELTFRAGGVLTGHVTPLIASILLGLYVYGFAALALPPAHRWLSVASVAPFPTIGVIHALALVPAGGVGLLKVVLYVFGPAMYDAEIAARILLAMAGLTMCVAALNALSKEDMRERLSYVTIAQTAAVTVGALLASPASMYAAILQIIAQSFAMLTLAMAFANVQAATGRTLAKQMHGLGRAMPWTFAGVAIAVVSLIGLPPLAGAWPKLWLMTAAAEAVSADNPLDQHPLLWVGGFVALSIIATFACLAPLAAQALVGAAPANPLQRPDRASIALVAPVVLLALAALALIAAVNPLYQFVMPIWSPT